MTTLYGSIMVLLIGTTAFAQVVHLGSDLPIIGNGSLAAQFVRAGNDAAGRGSIAEAKANYQDAINASPFDGNATIGLGRCAVAEGDLKAAVGYYRSAISAHHEEDNIDLQTEYIPVLAQAGYGKEAVSLYNHVADLCREGVCVTRMEIVPTVFRLDGSDYAPAKLQAMAHLIRAMNVGYGDDKRVSAEMQKAVSLAPDSAVVHFYEGVLLSRTDRSGAKKAFQQALNLDDGSNAKIINRWITTMK